MNYRVDYMYQLPGWDEFGKVRSDSEIVVADSPAEAMTKLEESNKYAVVTSATPITVSKGECDGL